MPGGLYTTNLDVLRTASVIGKAVRLAERIDMAWWKHKGFVPGDPNQQLPENDIGEYQPEVAMIARLACHRHKI